MVSCPICGKSVKQSNINNHIDSNCIEDVEQENTSIPSTSALAAAPVSSFFKTPSSSSKRGDRGDAFFSSSQPAPSFPPSLAAVLRAPPPPPPSSSVKRSFDNHTFTSTQPTQQQQQQQNGKHEQHNVQTTNDHDVPPQQPPLKRSKPSAGSHDRAAPLAERMRPRTLTSILGQDLVGPSGVLTSLIQQDRVPSMILWGASGTGKTTIARVIASMVGSRFVEINSTSSGVAECKKIFAEAKSELGLTGRKTIIFCDEIHRFSKSQQDVFLGPVEAGTVTLIGATTENPSFRVQGALLSRCRVFVLKKLEQDDILEILKRAVQQEGEKYGVSLFSQSPPSTSDGGDSNTNVTNGHGHDHGDLTPPGAGGGIETDGIPSSPSSSNLITTSLLSYLSTFADGDARTALNLLELAMSLSTRPGMTLPRLKQSLTKTLVYDRAGDQHYDTISAFHKSVRGSDADATLYYLARMLTSGEDPLYVARRMVVIASEDVGLADPRMLPLATATYTAVQTIGMPEARINLAHCAVSLALSPKSTRAYRGLENAMRALQEEPGVGGLPIPIHLRNAPTRLMKELGYGKEYKYNPDYKDGKVKQDYLPDPIRGRRFLEDLDLGTRIDDELG
ncbi:DNA-dependent ATPase mgs1 [Exophiala oligosperma]